MLYALKGYPIPLLTTGLSTKTLEADLVVLVPRDFGGLLLGLIPAAEAPRRTHFFMRPALRHLAQGGGARQHTSRRTLGNFQRSQTAAGGSVRHHQ